MMYVVSTEFDRFVFDTEEAMNDFLASAVLPPWTVQSVPNSPLLEKMAFDTEWRIR